MVEIRELTPADRPALKAFFLGLSDRTVGLMNHFDGRAGKTNTPIQAEMAAQTLGSDVVQNPDDAKNWIVEDVQINPEQPKEIIGLGFLRFVPYKPTQKYTCSLGIVIADSHQGRGVGHRLMQTMIDYAKMSGMRKVFLQVRADNGRAIALYERFDFVVEGVFLKQEWDGDDPITILAMGRHLV